MQRCCDAAWNMIAMESVSSWKMFCAEFYEIVSEMKNTWKHCNTYVNQQGFSHRKKKTIVFHLSYHFHSDRIVSHRIWMWWNQWNFDWEPNEWKWFESINWCIDASNNSRGQYIGLRKIRFIRNDWLFVVIG